MVKQLKEDSNKQLATGFVLFLTGLVLLATYFGMKNLFTNVYLTSIYLLVTYFITMAGIWFVIKNVF